MGVIDTSQWKEFRVGELFLCETTLSIPSKNDLIDGNINYITRSAIDNGVSGHCGNVESVNKGRCITIGAEGFVAFWQPDDFVAGNKVYTLRNTELNENRALFVCSALNVLSKDYSFANARVLDKIKKEIILLPATPSGDPDWDYMDFFMGKILEEEESVAEQLAALAPENAENGHFLDVSGWKAFRIGDLFNVCTTKSLDKLMLDLSDENEYAYVGRTGQNNGILGYLKRQDFEPNEADTFSVVQIGEKVCCYQTQAWYATQNIFKLKLQNHVSKNASLFLSSIITNTLKFVFGNNAYTSYPTKSGLKNLLISLPVTPDGQPDWAWMEQYMQQQMNKVEPLSKHLIQLL